ncbi:MAG: hypothetical protein MJ209_02725 [archaeon]|nr:hypothetical protein [archaeon]
MKVEDDFKIYSDKEEVKVNVIRAIENSLITEKEIATLKTENGVIQPDLENDVLKIAVVERYGGNTVANAFISGFGFSKGAIASSVAHNSHNIIVIGTNSEDMAKATNIVCENHGGLAVCYDDFEDSLPLPIAGLMSNETVEEVAEKINKLRTIVSEELNSKLSEPFMSLSFLALLIIPHIKLSDKGLFDGDGFEFIDVILE